VEVHGSLKESEGFIGKERLDSAHAQVENLFTAACKPLLALIDHFLVQHIHRLFSLR
jgi:hypothetical protein